MEYLIVTFEDDRGLVIDGEPLGRTNEVIELEGGTHLVTLEAPPYDFHPEEEVTVILEDTTALSPIEVYYEKLES